MTNPSCLLKSVHYKSGQAKGRKMTSQQGSGYRKHPVFKGQGTQTFSSALLHRGSTKSWQVLTLLYTKDLVWEPYLVLSRQQGILEFHCSRQMQLMCPAIFNRHCTGTCVISFCLLWYPPDPQVQSIKRISGGFATLAHGQSDWFLQWSWSAWFYLQWGDWL